MANVHEALDKSMKKLAAAIGLVLDLPIANDIGSYVLRVDDQVVIETSSRKTIRNYLDVLKRYHEAIEGRQKADRRGAIAHTKAKKAKASASA